MKKMFLIYMFLIYPIPTSADWTRRDYLPDQLMKDTRTFYKPGLVVTFISLGYLSGTAMLDAASYTKVFHQDLNQMIFDYKNLSSSGYFIHALYRTALSTKCAFGMFCTTLLGLSAAYFFLQVGYHAKDIVYAAKGVIFRKPTDSKK